MGKKEFDEFLSKQPPPTEPEIDPEKEKQEWIRQIGLFYEKIGNFLDEYKASGDVQMDYLETDIPDDPIGRHSVDSLRVRIKNKEVVFEPIGTNLIGAKGRIDMAGEAGTVRFVLVEEKLGDSKKSVIIGGEEAKSRGKAGQSSNGKQLTWKIATSPPRIQYLEMDAESFFDALMEVMNG